MKILTCTNLYPRPDEPARGVFNASLFRALADRLKEDDGGDRLLNICLVPEWRTWKWRSIVRWRDPFAQDLGTRYLPVFYLPVVGRNLSWRTYLAALRTLRGWGRGGDALLATWLYPDAVATAHFAEREGLPFWIKVHGSDRFHLHHAARRGVILDACSRAHGVISNCEFLAGELAGEGIVREKIHVVRNGVDRALFCPMAAESARAELFGVKDVLDGPAYSGQWTTSSGPTRQVQSQNLPLLRALRSPMVLFVGHLAPVKGPDLLLRSWHLFCDRRRKGSASSSLRSSSHPVLVFIGEGPMRRRLERMAKSLGVLGSVCFVGGRPHEELPLWMAACGCLCLPSRSEGMPNVVLESLACGRPVVAAGVGDVCRYVREGIDGCVVRQGPGFPVRLAGAIESTLSRDWNAREIATRWERSTWKQAAEDLLAIIRASLSASS